MQQDIEFHIHLFHTQTEIAGEYRICPYLRIRGQCLTVPYVLGYITVKEDLRKSLNISVICVHSCPTWN